MDEQQQTEKIEIVKKVEVVCLQYGLYRVGPASTTNPAEVRRLLAEALPDVFRARKPRNAKAVAAKK